ncbi:hypothetical protein [Pseudoalteromonas phage J2-1_QLiu-2017]|nr:hypothetical protein [Pseudoalteromonas phage J2-1_QLiu-2017]
MAIIIGSASYRPLSLVGDIDLVVTQEEFELVKEDFLDVEKRGDNKYKAHTENALLNKPMIVEITVIGCGNHFHLEHLYEGLNDTALSLNVSSAVSIVATSVSVPLFYTIALRESHKYVPNGMKRFYKNLDELQEIISWCGICKDIDHLIKFSQLAKKFHKKLENKKKHRHNVSKGEFFNDTVDYVYDHDSLHEALAIGSTPAYTLIKPDDRDVLVSRELFKNSSRETQINTVVEEVMVLALERMLIKTRRWDQEDYAFRLSFYKLCTGIASGWWRDFAYDNKEEVFRVWNSLPKGYIGKSLLSGLKKGIVVEHEKNKNDTRSTKTPTISGNP